MAGGRAKGKVETRGPELVARVAGVQQVSRIGFDVKAGRIGGIPGGGIKTDERIKLPAGADPRIARGTAFRPPQPPDGYAGPRHLRPSVAGG